MFRTCIADAIETTEILSKARPTMINVILKDGISHKTCIQCGYETTSADDMLSHLNQHNLEEIAELKANPSHFERVKR
jgi:Zn ribbon nucleic-acid-binding protein